MTKLLNKPIILTTFNNTIAANSIQAKEGTEFSWGSKDTETQLGINDFVDHLVNLCLSNCQ